MTHLHVVISMADKLCAIVGVHDTHGMMLQKLSSLNKVLFFRPIGIIYLVLVLWLGFLLRLCALYSGIKRIKTPSQFLWCFHHLFLSHHPLFIFFTHTQSYTLLSIYLSQLSLTLPLCNLINYFQLTHQGTCFWASGAGWKKGQCQLSEQSRPLMPSCLICDCYCWSLGDLWV